MASPDSITATRLARLVGLPDSPVLLDVRTEEDFAADPRLLPGALRRPWREVEAWAGALPPGPIVVLCLRGLKISEGVAAWLRHFGRRAEVLEGGVAGWTAAGLPTFDSTALPPRDAAGRTVWVTRARPKVDRIACPWLIRRFLDPRAVFLFVAASEVGSVAERFGATPFDVEADVEGVRWTHEGPLCTFDTMLAGFGLRVPALDRLAVIVRGADTARPGLAPESAGLLAASLGLSRMYRDDLAQLEAGMALYDAFHRWCRDATEEAHDWPNPARGSA